MGILTVRNVPDDLHRALKERAEREGTSVPELIRRELRHIASKPSLSGIADRVERAAPPEA
jgi:plasmid stability protein